jgi:hypothetical protein
MPEFLNKNFNSSSEMCSDLLKKKNVAIFTLYRILDLIKKDYLLDYAILISMVKILLQK